MAKPAIVKKPALAAKQVVKPATPAAAKAKAKKPAKVKAAPAKAKEVKPFADGEIVTFKGYQKAPTSVYFTEGEEIAIVGQRVEGEDVLLAAVKVADYHQYKADQNSVDGQEILSTEVKRTGKTVPPIYHLTVVGEMSAILKSQQGDPREQAITLRETAEKSFFYLGGVLCKLYKEKDEDTGKSIFTNYQSADGKSFEDSKEGFEAFCKETFGADFGGIRRAQYLMSIYESVSSLKNAAAIISELPTIKWWKAQLLASYITDTNATQLVKIAKEQNYDKLKETLKTQYTSEGTTARGHQASRATLKKTTFTFKLYEDAGAGVEYIMHAAQKQTGITDLNQVFEHIVQEWASDHLGDIAQKAQAAVDKKRRAAIKSGVKLPSDHPAAQEAQQAAE